MPPSKTPATEAAIFPSIKKSIELIKVESLKPVPEIYIRVPGSPEAGDIPLLSIFGCISKGIVRLPKVFVMVIPGCPITAVDGIEKDICVPSVAQ